MLGYFFPSYRTVGTRPIRGFPVLSLKGAAITVCCLIALFVLVSGDYVLLTAAAEEPVGTVAVDRLNLRAEPTVKSPVLAVMPRGAQVKIVERRNKWLKVTFKSQTGKSHTGYVRYLERYIRITGGKVADASGDLGKLRAKSGRIGEKLKTSQSEIKQIADKETSLINALNEIDFALDKAQKSVRSLKSEATAIDRKIKSTTKELAQLQPIYRLKIRNAGKRLEALYKLYWVGRINILATSDTVYDLFRRKTAVEKILSRDEKKLEGLLKDKRRLASLIETLNQQKSAKLELRESQREQIDLMTSERASRAVVLKKIRTRKSAKQAALSSLKKAARDLDQTIASLSKSPNSIVPPTTLKTKSATKKAVNTKPPKDTGGSGKDRLKAGPVVRQKSFAAFKGLLQLPVTGKIVTRFGTYKNAQFNVVNFRSGIDIQTEMGEPIHAVLDGRVIYSAWFKGYGNMIIIDHGKHYYTVYAHAQELFKQKGQKVDTGEVIATAGDGGSLIGPGLYFEIRHHGKPINPLKWIKRS